MLETTIVISNYFHDVATALLFTSAAMMLVVHRLIIEKADANRYELYHAFYRLFTRTAIASLVWIVAGGIPRTIFFRQIEWTTASANQIIPALIVKHIVMFTLVFSGIVMWRKIRRLLTEMKDKE